MLRILCIGAAAASLAIGSVAQASDPAVAGSVQGLEIAQQSTFNPAVFVGVFSGKVGGKTAFGAWAAGAEHEVPLPDASGESIAITGGSWNMQIWVLQGFRLRRVGLSGSLAGQLSFYAPDLFQIDALMQVTGGGSGNIQLDALLDHTVFPPAVSGALSQP